MLRNGLTAGAIVILAVVAAIGWTRAERSPAQANQPAAYTQPAAQPGNSGAPAVDGYGNPINGTAQTAGNTQSAYGNSGQAAYGSNGQTPYAQTAAYGNTAYGSSQ